MLHVLGVVGSLRRGSYNKSLMLTALKMMPPGTELEIFYLDGIPPFNQDQEGSPPRIVKELKEKIKKADAVIFATPEFNYSVPGVLKNAIDWASRPYIDNAWNGKPCAIMGASTGMIGTARAQYHLRQMCVYLNMYPINKPEVLINNADQKFINGELEDSMSLKKVGELLSALVQWIERLSGSARKQEDSKAI